MVGKMENKPGWSCDNCRQKPDFWWSSSCPKGCGHSVLACGRCATQASVEQSIQEHVASCSRALGEIVSSAPPAAPVRRELVRAGAKAGAAFGRARGANGVAAGGVIGAALGVLASHVLGLPEIQPIVDAARNLHGPVVDVIEIVRGTQKNTD